jgi:DNA-binding GntR family transcriptional regulator
VFDIIRHAIVSGRFVPGQRLVLRDLQEEFGFSRSTFREAFQRLVSEKLVTLIPNRGIAVQKLSKSELADLFQIRELLEGLAARLAAERIDVGDNRTRFLDVCKQLKADHLPERTVYIDQNQLFHATIVDMAGNSKLPELLGQMQIPILMSRWRQMMTQNDVAMSIQEHQAIIEAILGGHPDKADTAMRRHLNRAAKRTLATLNDLA